MLIIWKICNKIKTNMAIFSIKLISYLIMHVYILFWRFHYLMNNYIKLYCKINVDNSSINRMNEIINIVVKR